MSMDLTFLSNLTQEEREHLKKDLHFFINSANILSRRFKEANINDLKHLDIFMANKKIFKNAKKIVHLLNHVGITIDHFKEIHNDKEKEEKFHEIMEKVHELLGHGHDLGLDHIGTDARHALVNAYNAAVANKNLNDTQGLEEAEQAFIKELVLELGELTGIKEEKLQALRSHKGLLKELASDLAHLVGIKKEKLLTLKEKAKHVFVDLHHLAENKKGDHHLKENDINEHTRTKAIRRCVILMSEVVFIAKIAHYDFKHNEDHEGDDHHGDSHAEHFSKMNG